MQAWDPGLYRQFETERTRPARELLARIAVRHVAHVTDLGCGPGNSTELLYNAWPQARITGVDSAETMLAEARKRLPQCRFVQGDFCDWRPDAPQQVIYANASLQWADNHETLLPQWVGQLAEGGALAIQMPDNLDEPSHRLMREVAARQPWRDAVASGADARKKLLSAGRYYDLLIASGCEVDIWRTTYYHRMADVQAISRWLRATGLRPFLSALTEPQQKSFLTAYEKALGDAYPRQADGEILLAFPRLFIVAVKKG
ncbi:trans-aconitate 2-methyltransferase [Pantoea sp.]|uniref:trans-aconitate 2-methyltransferase n=1 Tax=Pantoea sp. TaxID=69393 RepID=UPI0028963049|nr:trans-aconitate 2-methyltransferase [Pantoea sp.]